MTESRKHELGGIFANLPIDGSPLDNPWSSESSPTVPVSTISPEELAELAAAAERPERSEQPQPPEPPAVASGEGPTRAASATQAPDAPTWTPAATTGWFLLLDTGQQLALPGPSFVVGRRPGESEGGLPTIAIPDPHKTISRVHARFDLIDDQWQATDLGSANGIVTVGPEGTESIIDPGGSTPVVGRFVLGLVGMQFVRIPGVQ